jgi:peptidoglycan hydrolase CwlO-like protein
MMKRLILTFIILLLTLPANAARTFTDSDLETYKQDSNVESKERYRPERTKEKKLRDSNDNKHTKKKRESWCRKGNKFRDKVNKAEKELAKAENRIDEYRKALAVRKSDLRSAMRKLKRSRERLEDTEEEYRKFKDRAYRQDIPRDWYECYYDGYDEYNK